MDPRQGIANDIDRETKGEQFQNEPLCPAYFQPKDSAIDVADAVTSRIDFDRISAPRSDAEHDVAIPPATASRLHFLPSSCSFFGTFSRRQVFEADKHAEASRKRSPLLSA